MGILNQSANGAEVHATIQRIALSDSIYPMYAHTWYTQLSANIFNIE